MATVFKEYREALQQAREDLIQAEQRHENAMATSESLAVEMNRLCCLINSLEALIGVPATDYSVEREQNRQLIRRARKRARAGKDFR